MADYAQGCCFCGSIKFQVAKPMHWSGYCHCSQCQRIHGAPVVAWVGFDTSDYKILDEQLLFRMFDSGQAVRGFCGKCGGHIFFKYKDKKIPIWGTYVYFSAVSFEEPNQFIIQENFHYQTRFHGFDTMQVTPWRK